MGGYAKENIKYVRHFSFHEINVININPKTPYILSDKPYVNYWFNGLNGETIVEFNRLLNTENIDRLEAEGGISIVYTHFGMGFYSGGEINTQFKCNI